MTRRRAAPRRTRGRSPAERTTPNEARDFLRAHGIDVPPASLDQMVAQAVAELPRTLHRSDPREDLTDAEIGALRRGGLDLKPVTLEKDDPLARTAADYAALLKTAKTVTQTAKLLRVNQSRVRQRLTAKPPTLYGLKVGSEWRVPSFLFERNALIHGIEEVVRVLSPTLHPVAFYRWFTTPDTDLEAQGISKKPLSPRDWLRLGLSPKTVAEIARDL